MIKKSNIKVDSDKFTKSIDLYKEKIKIVSDKLSSISNIMSEIDGKSDTWKSQTSSAVAEEFNDIKSNFDKINAELSAYDIFLEETLEEYQNEESKQEKTIEENNENLEIN